MEAIRELNGQVSTERRHYIASLAPYAELAANSVRTHWSVEKLHWVLDMAFREDDLRVRVGNTM
jgi:predicted transposase YbfD/YdcC